MKKRTEHFIQKPIYFDIECHICKSRNTEWSEYESYIWCPECNKDIELIHKFDVFPVEAARLIGFDLRRWDMVNKKVIDQP